MNMLDTYVNNFMFEADLKEIYLQSEDLFVLKSGNIFHVGIKKILIKKSFYI